MTVEQGENILQQIWPDSVTPLDGSAGKSRLDANALWVRGELSATLARLGLRPLWKQCRAGAPEQYAYTHVRSFAWNSNEDSYSLRLDPDGAGAQWLHAGRHAPDETLDFKTVRSSLGLDAAQAARLREAMARLQVARFPVDAGDRGSCVHSPIAVFETCIDGRYRMSYDACPPPSGLREHQVNAFRSAQDLLTALAPDPDPAAAQPGD